MDIFTTVLTRVVPVPIKPANLKVKALLKEAGTGKLKEDLDHLENHDYYFGQKKADNEQNKDEESKNKDDSEVMQAESSSAESKLADKKQTNNTDEGVTESKDGVKHLDLYV